jgi:hypothetical protein
VNCTSKERFEIRGVPARESRVVSPEGAKHFHVGAGAPSRIL